jgi:hypothetical protein
MRQQSLESVLTTLALLAAPGALAGLSQSQPLFESALAAARSASSEQGATVTREEARGALGRFFSDDSVVDAQERAYLSTQSSNAAFFTGFTTEATRYFTFFHELNDAATTPAPLGCYSVDQTPAEAFGTDGTLASSADIKQGFIPYSQGVANQLTLRTTYFNNFQVTGVGQFDPVTEAELRVQLSTRYDGMPVTQAEVDGAVAYINQIGGNSKRLYVASWINTRGRTAPGDLGGFVVAAVSTDRRYVRFVELRTWYE